MIRQPSSDFIKISHSVTFKLGWATTIACLSTFQFGFHLSVLNAPQNYISCKIGAGNDGHYEDSFWGKHDMKQCIPMNQEGIALITTMFTIGGLVSSMLIGFSSLQVKYGRRTISLINSLFFLMGCICLTFASNFTMLNVGRFFTGLGAGSSLVISPILVNELTPFNHRGLLGSLLQFAVASGILTSQLIAIKWSNPLQWRFIFVFACFIALFQFIILFTTVESPKWLIINKGDVNQATDILHDLRSEPRTVVHEINHWRRLSGGFSNANSSKNNIKINTLDDQNKGYEAFPNYNSVNQQLIQSSSVLESSDSTDSEIIPLTRQVSRRGSIDPSHIGIKEFLSSQKFKLERHAIWVIMTGQQLCGMNAITFYGVSILSNILPSNINVLYITCSLALCNVIASLMISPFIDKFGRKPLLLISLFIMAICSFLIGLGLIKQFDYLVATSCFGFIIGYSTGLGQLPFMMVSELTNHDSIGVAQSYGSAMNWIANIIVAYSFPIVQEKIGGNSFYIFFSICSIYFLLVLLKVPETKGKSNYHDVWSGF